MSAAPAKPARRRVHRDNEEGRFSASNDRVSDRESKSHSRPTEERDRGGTTTPPRGRDENSNADNKGPEKKEVGFKEPSKSPQRGPTSPNKAPRKAPKPTAKNDSLDTHTAKKSEAEEKDEIYTRSTAAPPNAGMLLAINTSLFEGWFGYRTRTQMTNGNHVPPYNIRGNPATVWALSLSIKSILADTTGLVKPAIKVHAVYKDSGMYVKSLRMPAAPPVSTAHVALNDVNAVRPSWNEDLLIAANYADVVNDNVVLLFELLDLRPSLRISHGSHPPRNAKRIAWAYLLPVNEGRLNVGICQDWKNTTKSSAGRGGRNDKPSRGGIAGAGASDTTGAEEKGKQTEEEKEEDAAAQEHIRNKKLKLQLFASVEDDGMIGAMQRSFMGWPAPKTEAMDRFGKCTSYPDGIPSVYMQWRRQNYESIDKGQLSLVAAPQETEFTAGLGGVVTTTAVHGDGTPQKRKSLGEGSVEGMPVAEAELARHENKAFTKAKTFAIKRLRGPTEPCSCPDKLLHRLEVGPDGAMTIQYSHSGHLLAIAAKTANVPAPYTGDLSSSSILGESYSLRLVDTDTGEEVWSQTIAHHGVIYSISWSLDNSYLVTASGDGTVKVWDVNCLLQSDHKDADEEESDVPYCLYSHVSSPPAYMYSAIFQEYAAAPKGNKPNVVNGVQILDEYLLKKSRNELPKVIAGGSDGRIRVWDGGEFKGYISIDGEEDLGVDESAPAAHNNARVHSLAIDSRSRYLISGDSLGNLFVWRSDSHDWYQLLRRFKQDVPPVDHDEAERAQLMQSTGVQSLCMHPDKTKSQLLVLNQMPSNLKVYSTSTYKPLTTCNGFGAGQVAPRTKASSKPNASANGSVFSKATFSPDGRYAVAGMSSSNNVANDGHYNLKFWEAKHGSINTTALSEINLPYPVRSISWHPSQHCVAVAMVGHGAAVAVYCGERESTELAIGRRAETELDDLLQTEAEKTQ